MSHEQNQNTEANSGLRAILKIPMLADFFQWMVGSPGMRRYVVDHYVKFPKGCKVLDIGCGTGELLDYMPQHIDYSGFDKDEKRIAFAKNKFGASRNFFSQDVNELDSTANPDGIYDVVLLFCVMHHLDDQETDKVLDYAKRVLKPMGTLITVDGVFIKNQNPLSRFILSKDRGRFVRSDDAYLQLVKKHFSNFEMEIKSKLLRIPTDLIIFKITK